MRLPVVLQLSTRDGISNKNARLTNVLKETRGQSQIAALRPGLGSLNDTTGIGKGLVTFNNNLVSVYGTTLGFEKTTVQWEYMEINYVDPVTYPYVFAIDYEDGNYIAVGHTSPGGDTFTMTSSDFLTWNVHATTGWETTIYGQDAPSDLNIAILNGTYYMPAYRSFTGTYIYSSPDGVTWAKGALITSGYVANDWGAFFRLGAKLYVKSGSTTYESTDAVTWSVSAIPSYITNASYSGSIYVATDSSDIFYSYDNVTWNTATLPDLNGDSVQMIGGGSQGFFAVTYYTGTILKSTDGAIWSIMANQPSLTGYSDFGGFGANDKEVCFLYYDNNYANLAVYNISYGTWSYVTGINIYRADYWLLTADKGFMSPHNLLVSSGVDADNRFVLTNTNTIRSLETLSGSFFDFAQSTL